MNRFAQCVCVCVCVCVKCTQFIDCNLSLETLATLTDLPQWTGTLFFLGCKWPERPAAYRLFAHTIPTTYSDWDLNGGHRREVAEHLCLGAAEHRKKSGVDKPLRVHSMRANSDQSVTHYSNGVRLVS